jgi:sec-independent protein translocase protein TatB
MGMQIFGVGVLELMVIFVLAIIVIGPDRLPGFAADLARWIRQTRAYARHLMGDFNQVVSELEKEAGASREDWKEIASVVTRHTGDIGKELNRVSTQVERSVDVDSPPALPPPSAAASTGNGDVEPAATSNGSSEAEAPAEEKPWYEPEKQTPRRRRREQ